MVVAFAPTVAFGATQTATAKITVSAHTTTGKVIEYSANYFDQGDDSGLKLALATLNEANVFVPTVVYSKTVDGVSQDVEGYFGLTTLGSVITGQLYEPDAATGTTTINGAKYKAYGAAFTVDTVELGMLADTKGVYSYTGATPLTIDLGGKTLTNVTEYDSATYASTAVLTPGSAAVKVQNGTIDAYSDDEDVTAKKGNIAKAINGTGELTVVSGTYDEISANVKKVEDGTFNAKVTDSAAGFEVKGGTFGDIAAASQTVTVKKGVTVTTGAITGSVTLEEGANLTATKSKSKVAETATAISAGTYEGMIPGFAAKSITGGSFTANPKDYIDADNYMIDDDGTYYIVSQGKAFNNVAASLAAFAPADQATIKKFVEDSLQAIAKGATSVDGIKLAEGVKASDLLAQAKVTGDQKLWIKWSKVDYNKKKVTDEQAAAVKAIDEYTNDSLQQLVYENGYDFYALTLQYTAKGATAPTILGTITDLGTKAEGRGTVANTVTLPVSADVYSSKVQVVAFDGSKVSVLPLYDEDEDGKPEAYQAYTYTEVTLANGDTTPAQDTTYYTDTFGSNPVTVNGANISDNPTTGEIKSGTYYTRTERTSVFTYKVNSAVIPTAVAVLTNDLEAIKDAAQKGEEVAVEKATQGIDVSKKSMTVKLGAKKTKTAKGKSFAMGASAETELTTAWKSGSTKITVSGDKVKLAKGAKRGTYTAKVSLKAAASDAYLAAAKTITVKFVIK